jgi:molecular chaperone GrpE
MSKNKKKADEKVTKIPVESPEEQPVENEEVKKLQEELEKKQQELDDTIRLLQRNQADFENFRRRNNSVRAESYENGKRDAVSELLPSLDDFDRIVSNADKADEAWVEGVKLVYRKFTDELKKLGLSEIEAEGKFDPNLHNAVLSEAADGVESETILAVLQKGYRMGDKILRHSMVKVSE